VAAHVHFHAVRFYENSAALCRLVAQFIGEGLAKGEPGLVIATAAHRDGILDNLRARRFDVSALQSAQELLLLDTGEALAEFMSDGAIDRERFASLFESMIGRVSSGGNGRTLRVYGEMVDVLWRAGRADVALQLEALGNTLVETHRLSMLCGYSTTNFYRDVDVKDIRRQHTHIVDIGGNLSPIAEGTRP
jgi:hypothetical protein